jgi:actin-related protein
MFPQAQVLKCINQFDAESRPELRNVLLTGGTTGFRNMQPRMQVELDALDDDDSGAGMNVRSSAFGGKLDAWIGGSMIASIKAFESICITRAEYDEFGPDVAHRKCL